MQRPMAYRTRSLTTLCSVLDRFLRKNIDRHSDIAHQGLQAVAHSLQNQTSSPRCWYSQEIETRKQAVSLVQQQFSVLKPPSEQSGPILRTPVYAIFELGSKQYKVSPGDVIWVERLKHVDVGAQLVMKRVQAAGSLTETIIGRPYVEDASVTAIVEACLCAVLGIRQCNQDSLTSLVMIVGLAGWGRVLLMHVNFLGS